jgi:hypothetical protein
MTSKTGILSRSRFPQKARNVDGDELARLLNRLDIELITRREAISVCLQIFPGKHMTLQFPVTNLFGGYIA